MKIIFIKIKNILLGSTPRVNSWVNLLTNTRSQPMNQTHKLAAPPTQPSRPTNWWSGLSHCITVNESTRPASSNLRGFQISPMTYRFGRLGWAAPFTILDSLDKLVDQGQSSPPPKKKKKKNLNNTSHDTMAYVCWSRNYYHDIRYYSNSVIKHLRTSSNTYQKNSQLYSSAITNLTIEWTYQPRSFCDFSSDHHANQC